MGFNRLSGPTSEKTREQSSKATVPGEGAQSAHQVEYIQRSRCPLCSEGHDCTEHLRPFQTLPDYESDLGSFQVLYCERCQVGFTQPYPSEKTAHFLYEDRKSSDFDMIKDDVIDKIKDRMSKHLLKKIAKGRKMTSVLDFSTGNGRFALNATQVFKDARVEAVDYEETVPASLKGSKVKYWNAREFKNSTQVYDLIFLRHVLEHVHHPVDLLRMLEKHLAPDGLLYIEVPNLDSGCGRVFSKYWTGFYVPRHIFHFTPASLQKVIQEAGMKATIGKTEMPLMGNTLAILTGLDKTNLFVKLAGVPLHLVQLAIEKAYHSSTCLSASCSK